MFFVTFVTIVPLGKATGSQIMSVLCIFLSTNTLIFHTVCEVFSSIIPAAAINIETHLRLVSIFHFTFMYDTYCRTIN